MAKRRVDVTKGLSSSPFSPSLTHRPHIRSECAHSHKPALTGRDSVHSDSSVDASLTSAGPHSMSRPISFSARLLSDEICRTVTALGRPRVYSASCGRPARAPPRTMIGFNRWSRSPHFHRRSRRGDARRRHARVNQVTWTRPRGLRAGAR